MSDERIEEALAAANFWLRTLEPCDCPEEVYPTGDRLTIHEPFCSTVMLSVAAALREAQEALKQIAETARWYADNGQRLAHEVDHALCVEILSIAENAVSPPADEEQA